MIIATYISEHDASLFGLSDVPLNFDFIEAKYAAVFSLTGKRSYCNYLNCKVCPFSHHVFNDTLPNCQFAITQRNPYFLSLFGITSDNNPEYFI